MKTEDGRLIVVGGASRSGKTAYVRKAVQSERRVMAWDPEDQWSQLRGWQRVTDMSGLLRMAATPGAMRVAYVAGGDLPQQFGFWAGCVQYAGRYVEPLAAVAEELGDVTTPSKAPGNWGILLRRGLKRGITIYALSQRWQEADKTAVGNASEFVLFRQNGPEAARYLARKTGVPPERIPTEPLRYVRFDPATGEISEGRLRF